MKYPNLLDQFEMIMQHVQDENYPEATATVATFKMRLEALEAELKQKDEKLSEFENGLPIEKADKEFYYLYVDDHNYPHRAFWSDMQKRWCYSGTKRIVRLNSDTSRLFFLPSTETQEGS